MVSARNVILFEVDRSGNQRRTTGRGDADLVTGYRIVDDRRLRRVLVDRLNDIGAEESPMKRLFLTTSAVFVSVAVL